MLPMFLQGVCTSLEIEVKQACSSKVKDGARLLTSHTYKWRLGGRTSTLEMKTVRPWRTMLRGAGSDPITEPRGFATRQGKGPAAEVMRPG